MEEHYHHDQDNQHEPNHQGSPEMVSERNDVVTPIALGQSGLEKLASYILIIVTFLAPVFFLPAITNPFYLTKAVLIYLPVILSLILVAVVVIRRGVLPKWHRLLGIGAGATGITFLLSAFTGLSWSHSLIGYGFEVGSVVFWIVMLLLSYVISFLFRSNERVVYLYLSLFTASALVLLWLIMRLLAGPEVLSFGLFNSLVSNPVGSWNDLGVFLALTVLLSNVTLQFLSLGRGGRLAVTIVMYLSLAVMLVINFGLIWKLLLISIIALVYFARRKNQPEATVGEMGNEALSLPRRRVSKHSLVIMVVALIFIFLPTSLTNQIPSALDVSYLEVRPAWSSTAKLYVKAVTDNPLLGVGENNFFSVWSNHKPAGVNLTDFWSVDFNYAVGLIPTMAIMTGLLGTVALLVLVVALIQMTIKTWRFRSNDLLTEYLVASSFLGAVMLWLVNIFYVPTFAITFLSFTFLGLWLAMIYDKKIISVTSVELGKNKLLNLISIVLLVAFIIISVVFGYTMIRKYRASLLLQAGITALNETNNIGQAETEVLKAITLDPQDIYYRSLSELVLLRLNTVVSLNGGQVTDEIAEAVQELINTTIATANEAINLRPNDYSNHLFLARIYGSFVAGGLPGAYERSREVYDRTIAMNPTNPGLYLELARLELSHNDTEKARAEIARAVQVKPNYTDAIFLLSQIEVAEGKVPQAIKSVEAAISTAPANPLLHFQLGLLHYNQNNYVKAKIAFEQAVIIVPDYANAKYFLGLTYNRLEDNSEAIRQFEEIKKSNPNNTEVDFILNNLRFGNDPFEGATPPIDDEPQARDNPPIDESLEVDDNR